MAYDAYNHFITIVAGDDPEKLMGEYDKNLQVEPYVVYAKKDAEKLRNQYLNYYKALVRELTGKNGLEEDAEDAKKMLDLIEHQTVEKFFDALASPYYRDKKTGDAISTDNPDGKWSSFAMGQFLSVPFINLDGDEKFQEIKDNIDWPLIHLNNQDVYERAWEMVMDGSEPRNEDERNIYENMKNRTFYFSKFGEKENYVASSTAFWGYAFLSEETGWLELEDDMDQFVWMTNYYDHFIKPLPGNTLLTIYECVK